MQKPMPMPEELERRIEAIERHDLAGDLNRASWFWLLLFGIAIPAALLLWGWWA
jgi:hypothetical protein